MPAVWVIVPAAGLGARMQSNVPKQYLALAGATVIEQTLERLLQTPHLAGIVVALHSDDDRFNQLTVASDARISWIQGGAERADSVLKALEYVSTKSNATDWALVHDAARPCLPVAKLISFTLEVMRTNRGAILALPVADTLKRVDDCNRIITTQDRRNLWAAQTPQMFQVQELLTALNAAACQNVAVTDEASAIEAAGKSVQVIAGSSENIKVTRPEDLPLAELIISSQKLSEK